MKRKKPPEDLYEVLKKKPVGIVSLDEPSALFMWEGMRWYSVAYKAKDGKQVYEMLRRRDNGKTLWLRKK